MRLLPDKICPTISLIKYITKKIAKVSNLHQVVQIVCHWMAWSNVNNEPIICATVITEIGIFYIDTSGTPHTATLFDAQKFMSPINVWGERLSQIQCFFNHSTISMKKTVVKTAKQLLPSGFLPLIINSWQNKIHLPT